MHDLPPRVQQTTSFQLSLPLNNLLVGAVGSIDRASGDRSTLRDLLAFSVNINTTFHFLGRAEWRESLGLHVAEVTVGSHKIGTPTLRVAT